MDWRVEGGADAVVGLLRKLLTDHTLSVDSVEIVAIREHKENPKEDLSGKAVLNTEQAVVSSPSHDKNVMSPGSITALIVCISLLVVAVSAALVVLAVRSKSTQSVAMDGEESNFLRLDDELWPACEY